MVHLGNRNLVVQVPREYGYVVLAASATLFNLMWHAHRGSPSRQAARLPWPYQHASRAEVNSANLPELKRALHLFNCAQQAHENYMENLPCLLLPLMISGLRWPIVAAAMGLLWNLGRVFYALGYKRYGPPNRLSDAVAAIMHRVGYTMPGARNGMGRLWGSWFNMIQVVLMFMATRVVGWDMVQL
ncbi:hypothetical protein LA080_000242 [Diaporthe eres]|nr:hypothetical protein LA080_000242 [Diaporthe eres]